ncbi:MAG: zinc ribbon domain-containing protein [Candidatus Hermodarchaeota archaeon]
MARFCSNCGSPVEEDWNVCANCGSRLTVKPVEDFKSVSGDISPSITPSSVESVYKPIEPSIKAKGTHKYWILSLIAGIISLIGLITPVLYKTLGFGTVFLGFIFGLIVIFQIGYGISSGWTTSPIELTISIISTVIILTSAIIIIIQSARLRKSGKYYSNVIFAFGFVSIGGVLSYIISFEILSRILGYGSFWLDVSIGPALYLLFGAFILVIIGYSIGKKRS